MGSPVPLLPPATLVWLATLTELLCPLTPPLLLLPVLATSVPSLLPMELLLALLPPSLLLRDMLDPSTWTSSLLLPIPMELLLLLMSLLWLLLVLPICPQRLLLPLLLVLLPLLSLLPPLAMLDPST